MAANDNAPTDLPLAVVDDVTTTPVLLMVHSDHLGRPIRMTDASKATVWAASYKPWGEPQSISGTRALDLRFPGQYFQIETSLAYNWHRYYDTTTGRYTQPDPLGFVDGPSVYAYAANSPFMKTDKDGRLVVSIGGISIWVPDSTPLNLWNWLTKPNTLNDPANDNFRGRCTFVSKTKTRTCPELTICQYRCMKSGYSWYKQITLPQGATSCRNWIVDSQ
jgi:RHS repeat-associated protein